MAGQSLLDIATQEAGTMGALFDLATANGQSITDNLSPGNNVEVPEAMTIKKRDAAYMKDNDLHPGTAQTNNGTGIGFYIIGQNFIIA